MLRVLTSQLLAYLACFWFILNHKSFKKNSEQIMRKYQNYFILFCVLTSAIANAQDNSTTPPNNQDSNLPTIVILEDDTEININMRRGEFNFYQFTVTEKIPEYDLTISVDPFDPISDPDIFTSRTNKYPNSTMNSDLYGISFGYDMITIDSQEINQNDTYYFGIKCSSLTCNFTLRLQYTGEFYMSIGYTVRMFYSSTSSEVIKMNIPVDLPVNTSHIIIYAELLNIYDITETFHMYVNQGNEIPTSTTYELTSKTSWLNGKAIVIYNDSQYFCTNCNYTILLEAQKGTIIDISTLIYSQIMPVQLGELIYDAISYEENVTYTLNLSQIQNFDQQDLAIELSPYYGHPELYIEFDILPEKFEDYRMKSTQTGRKKFTITPKERQDANVSSNSTVYITVYGRTSTTYKISIQTSETQANQIHLGESQIGQIDAYEIINYLYSEWNSHDSNVTITLTSSSGKLGIFVKSCDDKDDCQFSQTDIDNISNGTTNISDNYPVTVYSDHTSDINTIKFVHNGTTCAPKSLDGTFMPFFSARLCYYGVALVNLEDNKYVTSSYLLLAETDESITPLIENIPIRGHVEMLDYSYYVFTLTENDPTIQSITFQITPFSGSVYVFSSKTIQYPNSSEYDKSSYFRDFITYDSEDNIDFSGNFYISIKGVDSSSYTITTLIKRSNTSNDTNIISITEGVPQKFTMKFDDVGYTRFNVDLRNSLYGEIEVMLTAIQGNFAFYVTADGTLPSPENNDYVSYFGGPLLINIDDENFKGTGEFIVAINPKTYYGANNSDQDFICTVAFVSEYNVFELQPEIPFMDMISNNRTIFFKIELFPEDTFVEILKVAFNDDFDLFLSSEKTTPFPNKDNYFDTTVNSTSPRIFLNNDNITELCNFTIKSSSKWIHPTCYLAISASTSYNDDVWMGVLFKKTSSYVMLRDGMQLEMVYPNASEPLLFYYYPKKTSSLYLILDTIYQDIQLYATVIKSDDYDSRKNWPFPNATNSSYVLDTSKTHKSVGNELVIPKNDLTSCTSDYFLNCVLLFTIVSDHTPNITSSMGEFFEPTFGLVITSEITPIIPGKPVYSFVEDNSYRYFSIIVTNPNSTLLITLTPFGDGNPDLLVSFGKESRPTFESSQFSSTAYQSGVVQISKEDLGERKTMEGTWVIGVFGFEACNFELTALFEDNKVIQITGNLPFEFDLDQNKKLYFEFFNWWETNFTIKLINHMGDAQLYVDTFEYKEDFIDQLPNSTNNLWSLTTKRALNSLAIKSTDPNYCVYCSYLIAVEAKTQTRMSILINLEGEFTTLTAGKTVHGYIPTGKNDTYEFFTSMNSNTIDINLIVYSGLPEIYVHHNPTVNSSSYIWKYVPKANENVINFKINHNSSTENFESIFDGQFYWSSNPDIYYIMIIGSSAVNYTIYVTVPGSSSLLLDGIIGFSSLFPGESVSFDYLSMMDDQNNSNKPMKLGINLYNDQYSAANNAASIVTYPLINVTFSSWNDYSEKYLPFSQDIISFSGSQSDLKLSQILKIPKYSGIYSINITNNYTDQPINFSMVINQKEYLLIPPNTIHMSRLGIQEEEIYEIYVNQSAVLVIEIFECLGKVVFAATKKFENLQNRVFDLEVRKPSLNGLYGELKIDSPGTIYLSVKAISGYVLSNSETNIKEALYKIQTKLFIGDKFPYDYFIPGDEGRIRWNISDNNKVHLTWFDSTMDTDGISEDSKMKEYTVKYEYRLIVTRDELAADSLARCDLMPSSLGGDFSNQSNYSRVIDSVVTKADNNNTQEKDYDIDLEEGNNYFISLVCLTQGINHGDNDIAWQFPMIYETTQVNIPVSLRIENSENETLLIWIIAGCAIGLIIVSLGLLYYFKRYKKAVKKLNYEMQDVRNIAGITGEEILDERVIDIKAKYSGLVEEKTSP